MKAQTLRNAVDAHGWVGVVVSVPLFVVFWAGAVTLFYPEVRHWALAPLVDTEPAPADTPALHEVTERTLAGLDRNPDKPVWLTLPGEHAPLLEVYAPIKPAEDGADQAEFLVDPKSGNVVARGEAYQFADFLYQLHYNLKLPQGGYIVGLITLFFLVLVMTGVVIQLKNLIKNFFLYRHDRGKRQRLYDLHTVTGVVTMPFALLYSLTGLMFNLSILFYLPSLMLVYAGDQQAMMKAAGFPRFEAEAAGVAAPVPALEPIIERVEQEEDAHVTRLGLFNYGDENGFVRVGGVSRRDGFPRRVDRYYEVRSASFAEQEDSGNVDGPFRSTVMLLFTLHMASFGGPGVRLLFFVLALGICGMIVAGNLLWLAKREAKADKFPRSLKVVQGITLGGCVGVVGATSVGFLFERLLPSAWPFRGEVVQGAFLATLLVATVIGFRVTRVRAYLATACACSSAFFAAVVLVDLLAYGGHIAELWNRGDRAVLGVTVGLAAMAVLLAFMSRWIRGATGSTQPVEPVMQADSVAG